MRREVCPFHVSLHEICRRSIRSIAGRSLTRRNVSKNNFGLQFIARTRRSAPRMRAGIHLRIPRHGGENDPARNRETTALLCGMTSIPTKIRIVTLLQRRENESSDAAPSGPHRPQTHCVPGFWC
jgi:hypothetical protein